MFETATEILAAAGLSGENEVPEGDFSGTETTDDGTFVSDQDTSPDNSTETEEEFQLADINTLPVELHGHYKSMQANMTRKLQEAAAIRAQFEGLDPQMAQAVREYNQLLQTDPRQAAEWLRRNAEAVDQQTGYQKPVDPFAGFTPVTDSEEQLVNVARQMWERQQQQDQFIANQQHLAHRSAVEKEFADLGKAIGRNVTVAERKEVADFCVKTGCQDVTAAWKAVNYDRAVQRGVDKAAGTIQQKKQIAGLPGGGKQQRSAPVPASSGKLTIAQRFAEAEAQHNGG